MTKPELKPLSRGAVASALEKAVRYRLLGEPSLAESICADVLAVEPDHQQALTTLILTLTDQLRTPGFRVSDHRVEELLPRLQSAYERAYYSGLVSERRGLAALDRSQAGHAAWTWIREALAHYEDAQRLAPQGNDDAVLRWNTCVRVLRHNLVSAPQPDAVQTFD